MDYKGVPVFNIKTFQFPGAWRVSNAAPFYSGFRNPFESSETLATLNDALTVAWNRKWRIRTRREHATPDLLGALVATEEAGDKLSEDELIAMIFLLLIAGHETTVNLIGNGTLALIENLHEAERLRPKDVAMKLGVEEMLRYYTPVELATERWAREDIRFGNTVIPKGELVFAGFLQSDRNVRERGRIPRARLSIPRFVAVMLLSFPE
jgi:cytochrome P450